MVSLGFFSDQGLNFLQAFFTWIGYNRDIYSDNLQMRQNQLYQEKNYHISWVAIARDDVRDIMQTSVGRLNNYLIVVTLIFSVTAAMVVEGEVDEDAEDFVRNAYYANLIVSVVYFVLSILFCVAGSTESWTSSLDLLSQELRPDHPDAYDFNYMKQTQQVEYKLRNALRVPMLGLARKTVKEKMRDYAARANVCSGGIDESKMTSPSLARTFTKEVLTKPALVTPSRPAVEHARNGRVGATEGLWTWAPEGSRMGRSADLAEMEMLSKQQEGEQKYDTGWYFARFRAFSGLWQPYEDAARRCMCYGILALNHAAAYFIIGKLHGRSERWVALTLFCLFIYMGVLLFFSNFYADTTDRRSAFAKAVATEPGASCSVGADFLSRTVGGITQTNTLGRTESAQTVDSGTVASSLSVGPTTRKTEWGAMTLFIFTFTVLVCGPLCFAAAVRVKGGGGLVPGVCVPLCFLCHLMLSALCLLQDHLRIWACQQDAALRANGGSSVGTESAGRGTESAGSRLRRALTPVVVGSKAEEDESVSDDLEVDHHQHRHNEEKALYLQVENYQPKIDQAFLLATRQTRLAHLCVTAMWFSLLVESFFSVTFNPMGVGHIERRLSPALSPTVGAAVSGKASVVGDWATAAPAGPEAPSGSAAAWSWPARPPRDAELLEASVPVRWPSRHFRPRALACVGSDVFLADEFRIFRLSGETLEPVRCDVEGPIVDVDLVCEERECRPVALVSRPGEALHADVVDCSRGTSMPLLQPQGRAGRLSALGPSAVAVLQEGGRLVEHQPSQWRQGWQPLWELATLDARGVVATDVSDGRLAVFRGGAGPSAGSVIEVRSLEASGEEAAAWRLTANASAPLVGGCLPSRSEALVLAAGGPPSLARLRLGGRGG